MSKFVASAKELEVYKMAFKQSITIFNLSKKFPREEMYSLTHQVRRSSRSVCANLREMWAKRRYKAHFISKLTDCDGENQETETHLDFALACGYLTPEQHHSRINQNLQINRMLGKMITQPEPWILA